MVLHYIENMKRSTLRPQRKTYAPRTGITYVQGGKKKHGSHRSHIIGKYKLQHKPVTELNQPGIVWY